MKLKYNESNIYKECDRRLAGGDGRPAIDIPGSRIVRSSSGFDSRISPNLSLSRHRFEQSKNSYNSINERPLERNSKELSFKGLNATKGAKHVTKGLKLFSENNEYKNYKKIISLVDDKFDLGMLSRLEDLKTTLPKRVFEKNGTSGTLVIKNKGVLPLVLDSMLYPVTKMPFEIADFVIENLRKLPKLKNSKVLKKAFDSNVLSTRRLTARKEDQINALKGVLEQVSGLQKKHTDSKILDKKIFELVQGFSDPKKGNYNTVHERALNRIVSGTIPAFYLANDAYNLSRYCDDNKDLADKEKKTRFNQELTRVGLTAYLQLVTLGGFTKLVNNTPWGAPLIATGTVLLSETSSRLGNGKPVGFISSEQAKKHNKKSGKNKTSTDENSTDKNFKYLGVTFKSASPNKVFASFSGLSVDVKNTSKSDNNKKEGYENKSKKKDGDIFNFNTLKKYVALSIAGGLALMSVKKISSISRIARKNAGKSSQYADIIEETSSKISKKYKNFFQKDYLIKKDKFNSLMQKLKDGGAEKIAVGYEELAKGHTGEVMNLGKVNKASKSFADIFVNVGKFVWSAAALPFNMARNVAGFVTSGKKVSQNKFVKSFRNFLNIKQKPETVLKDTDILRRAVIKLSKESKKLDSKGLAESAKKFYRASFNNQTKSSGSNVDLAKATKLVSSAATSAFLVTDNYNMVMLKSDGEDKKGANLKAKERVVQRISSLFYQMLFIDLFNTRFASTYHSSLMGMSAVTAVTTMCTENVSRASIGCPLGEKSREQIVELEKKNAERKGFAGKYFKFMTKLTGKKTIAASALKANEKNLADNKTKPASLTTEFKGLKEFEQFVHTQK